MMKRVWIRGIGLLCVLCLITGCTATTNKTSSEKVPFTVTVKTNGGMPLDGVMVRFYTDKSAEQLVWAGETDKSGQLAFTAPDQALTAVLENAPTGYAVASHYTVTTDATEIVLDASLLDADALQTQTFGLGDVMCDFTVEVNAQPYTLSELLKEKSAVVLNFFFENCGPCRMEFPFLQEAYEQYADDVAVIAINPLDGTAASVAQYAADLGLTFPVIAGDMSWINAFSLNAYPTTVVIDRYGMIAMMHKGAVPDTAMFIKLFEYFTAEDYVQQTVRNLSDL